MVFQERIVRTKLDIYAFYATTDAVLLRGALTFLAATILNAFTIIMYVKHGL
jgi:hypothetical protein